MKLLDFVDEIVSGKEKAKSNILILVAYFVYACLALVVWSHFSDKDFSYVCTLAGLVQTLAFFLLLNKMRTQKSCAGVSSKTLQVYVLVFTFRLSSTMVKNGYLPVDRSGDWVYQATDIASLLLVFQLMFFVHKRYGLTYQAELDSMPIWKIVPAFMLLGCCCHGELNHSAFFDKTWTIGMWMDTIAMLPQLWMLVAKGGEVEALTSNFVALIFVSKALSWCFWYTGYAELAPKDGGFNLVGNMVMGAQSLQLLLSADFMYHYFSYHSNRMQANCGLMCTDQKAPKLVLPVSGEIDI
jgi:hypothetical protein